MKRYPMQLNENDMLLVEEIANKRPAMKRDDPSKQVKEVIRIAYNAVMTGKQQDSIYNLRFPTH